MCSKATLFWIAVVTEIVVVCIYSYSFHLTPRTAAMDVSRDKLTINSTNSSLVLEVIPEEVIDHHVPQNQQQWNIDKFLKLNVGGRLERIKYMAETVFSSSNSSAFTTSMSTVLVELKKSLPKRPPTSLKGSASIYQTKRDISMIPEPYKNPDAKTLAFVKPRKVGSTTVGSLLSMYAYLYNLELGRVGTWIDSIRSKPKICVDVVGTYHPPSEFYNKLHNASLKSSYEYYCKEAVEFMFIRNPIDRLWSGYHHYKRSKSKATLESYLRCSTGLCDTNQPPHVLLSKDIGTALRLSEHLLMLTSDSQKMMDISLMLLSIDAQMSVCDFMYEPCSKNQDWSTSKCYTQSKNIPPGELQLLKEHAMTSGEEKFYQHIKPKFEAMTSNNKELQKRLKAFNLLRDEALDQCGEETASYKLAEHFLASDPRVRQETSRSNRRWIQRGEGLHTLDPKWLCMQWYCHKALPDPSLSEK